MRVVEQAAGPRTSPGCRILSFSEGGSCHGGPGIEGWMCHRWPNVTLRPPFSGGIGRQFMAFRPWIEEVATRGGLALRLLDRFRRSSRVRSCGWADEIR